jgi:hypothetical protein
LSNNRIIIWPVRNDAVLIVFITILHYGVKRNTVVIVCKISRFSLITLLATFKPLPSLLVEGWGICSQMLKGAYTAACYKWIILSSSSSCSSSSSSSFLLLLLLILLFHSSFSSSFPPPPPSSSVALQSNADLHHLNGLLPASSVF